MFRVQLRNQILKIIFKNSLKEMNLANLSIMKILLIICCLHYCILGHCVHDDFAANTTKHFFNDLSQDQFEAGKTYGRILQSQGKEGQKIRIFMDYSQLTVGNPTEINTIKRISNITASYFYNLLKVVRLDRLYFPETQNDQRKCNVMTVPRKYVTEGTIGDVGVIVGNQENADAIYVAKSSPCAFLESNKRPIWGMMQFNNAYLKFDQQGFQQIVFVGIHEMTHILGFSALMYQMYPAGNPLKTMPNGDNFLSSPRINEEVKKHYNCSSDNGLPLEDQDGTLIASHWQRKAVGNEFMIASNKKGSFISRFTLALFESTGWYTDVDYQYAQETTWGRNKGCEFLNIDNCQFEQFCQGSSFECDWEGTAIGKCSTDPFAGSCQMVKYYTNTVCVDENYELKNLNSKLNTLERGGANSKCFKSNYRQTGLKASKLNNRCYISVCSFSGRYVFILVGSYILVCRSPNQEIQSPLGLDGTLTCPSDFSNYCQNKQSCPYHCNKNGACLNQKCLCTGSTTLTPQCLDISIYEAPVGSTGGLLNSLKDQSDENVLVLDELDLLGQELTFGSSKKAQHRPVVTKYSINKKCFTGMVFDPVFGECLECREVFNCTNCDESGCISCDGNVAPQQGKCYQKESHTLKWTL